MQFDRKHNDVTHASGVSCAFDQANVNGQRERTLVYNRRPDGSIDWYGGAHTWKEESDEEHENRLWDALCGILTAAERRSVLVPTTDKEPVWRDLIAACPYAQFIGEARSHHGNYKAQLWAFNLKGSK